jgi:hypothetical protein
MVVAVGDTDTPTPLVTDMLPGVITPVPFEKTAVKVEELPELMVEGEAAKLVIVGGATTTSVPSNGAAFAFD